ncbi:MAG: carbohydrate ABC transporter permease [Clostridiales bacterium]|jgi:multiple sugar transport system permease protein|nr:carbohydrate ABC transporter permease [Clostridiales bacterium]
MNAKIQKQVMNAIRMIVIILLCCMFLTPIVVMLSTSVMTRAEALSPGGFHLIPREFYPDNYKLALERLPYFKYMGNTMWITFWCLVGQLISAPMVAYSLSKIRWKGREPLLTLVMSTMMIPYVVTMIPLYRVWANLKLTGTYAPLIVPAFFSSPFYVIILRQFFMNIPDSLVDAARIDGASEFGIYARVVLPLGKPAVSVIGIFVMLNTWSDYLGPLLYLNRQEMYTLSIGLQAFNNSYNVEWTQLMAAATMFVLPVLVVFLLFQRSLIDGISTTGLK